MKIRITAVAAALTFASSAAFAAPGDVLGGGNILFEGTVSTDSCYVTSPNGDARTIRVDMGTVNVGEFDTATIDNPLRRGDARNDISFNLQCSQDTAAKITFSAPAGHIDSTKLLKINGGLTGDSRFASGFGIAVYKGSTTTNASALPLADGELFRGTMVAGAPQQVSFQTGYVKIGTVTGGIAKATLPFTITVP